MPHGDGAQYVWTPILDLFSALPFHPYCNKCCNTNSPGYHSSNWGERCVHTAFQTLTPNPGATKRQMLVPYEVCSSSYLVGFPSINLQQAGLQMTYPRFLFIPVFYIYIIWSDIAWYSVWCIAPMKQGRGAAHMAKHGQTVGFLT